MASSSTRLGWRTRKSGRREDLFVGATKFVSIAKRSLRVHDTDATQNSFKQISSRLPGFL